VEASVTIINGGAFATQVGGPGAGAGQAINVFLGTLPAVLRAAIRWRQALPITTWFNQPGCMHSQPNTEMSGLKCSEGPGAQGLEGEAYMCSEYVTSYL
jgi:hypothetical protein